MNGNITTSNSSFDSVIGICFDTAKWRFIVGMLFLLGGKIKTNETLVGIGSGREGSEIRLVVFSGTIALICNTDLEKFPINSLSIQLLSASLSFGTQGDELFCVSQSRGSRTLREADPLSNLNATFPAVWKSQL
jgi:hypothetical protein